MLLVSSVTLLICMFFPSVILHFHPHVLQLCIVVMVVPSPHPSSLSARCFRRLLLPGRLGLLACAVYYSPTLPLHFAY